MRAARALLASVLVLSGAGASLVSGALAGDDVTVRRVVVAPTSKPLVIELPVSEDMTYVDGTASSPEHLVFSLDGGRRFAPLRDLRVIDLAGPRPATAADVTTLRWKLPARQGERVEVSYRAAAR